MSISETKTQQDSERSLLQRYKDANQAYIVLGFAHFGLIAPGLAAGSIQDGTHPILAILGGFLTGLVFLLLFLHLAEYHGEAGEGSGNLVKEASE